MPHLTLQLSPGGPLIDVLVAVSTPRGQALSAAGQPIPAPIQIRALIDTGASHTCIDPTVLSALALSPTGHVQMHTPSTGSIPHQADAYDISLVLLNPKINFTLGAVQVSASQLKFQGF